MPELRDIRLVYIAPASGESGVGDYADDFAAAVRPHLSSVVEYRHAGPGKDSLLDLWRHRSQISRLVRDSGSAVTIVHSEHSGGAMLPLWGTVGLGSVTVTATVHDPPLSVWWPFRSKLAARFRLINHGLHFPLRGVTPLLEARLNRGKTLVALSRVGAAELAKVMNRSTVIASALIVPEREPLDPVVDRPLAIGLFGYVYRGKGFESLVRLRTLLPPDVAIRVAGRGTQNLPPVDGVEILGELIGKQEDAFFNSIRMLLVPYDARPVYRREAFPAASVVSRAMAYGTPVLCRGHGALVELQEEGGAVIVDGGIDDLATAANSLLRDSVVLTELERGTRHVREKYSAEQVANTFLSIWRQAR